MNTDGFLSTQQAAERLGVKVESVYTFARRLDGFPQPVKIGRTLLWPEKELDVWRAAHPARKTRPESGLTPPGRPGPAPFT